MSNNVVSQQFQIHDSQMVKMEHMSGMSDTLSRGSPMEIARHVTHNPALLHSVVSNENTGPVEPIPNSQCFQNLSNGQMRPVEPNEGIGGFRQTEATVNGLGPQSSSLPIKRKAEMELTGRYSVPQQLAVPNKRAVPAGSSPRLPSSLQTSSHKKHVPVQSKATSTAFQNIPALNKKLVRNDSTSGKSGSHQVQTPKGRTMQMDSDPRVVHLGSNDAVRSKMRDQLAAALSLVLQNKEETINGETNHLGEAGNQQASSASQHLVSDSSAVGAEEQKTQESGNLQFQEPFSAGESGSSKKSFGSVSTDESQCASNQSSKELRSSIFPEEDGLFVKDDLLQGNGLSWAYDFDMGNTELIDVHDTAEPKLADEESGGVKTETIRLSPEKLALEIEAELFKLFSGVNKKYKEKGRSLLFNLKDSSNPELRESVMSGKIPPDRLCSMTAEELASKELSEWRMAKAEELAQMVVLPDTDFSRRRMVKKTHKGEYQVDYEEDYSSLATDVSGGPSVLAQSKPESKEKEINPSSKVDATNVKTTTESESRKSENQEISDSLVIPSDGTDLMHGMMVDELKDAEFLPPIISLDDFMECLNSEPPFQDLQVDAAHSSISSAKENQVSNVSPSSAPVGDAIKTKVEEMVVVQQVDVASKLSKSPAVLEKDVPKRSESPVKEEILPTKLVSPEIEHIWAGILQLSISSSITTFGVFKSGEKTPTAEWSSSLEIKGRVRLDAFEKFVKELPMSRTRAVMVLHLVLKDKSSEIERANLAEAVESYVSDERLGFAEPAAGVELYVCPAHEKMFGVLGNYVVEHRDDFLNSIENSLIGIVVWRKAPITIISPNSSSSHHKHSSKRQQIIPPGRPQEKDLNLNMKSMPKAPPPLLHNQQLPVIRHPPPPSDDDDSDIPPGFGPASQDDDDLPEFNFAGNTTPGMTRTLHQTPMVSKMVPSPVDQIRQLIHKYGQNDPNASNDSLLDSKRNSIGLAMEPWNDDDDDMPEWRPNVPMHSHPLARPMHPGYGNQLLVHNTGIQQHLNPRGVVNGLHPGLQNVPGGRWQPPVNFGNQPSGVVQLPTRPLHASQRRDISRSRGF